MFRKNVSPENLEEWLTYNKMEVYERSLEIAKEIIEDSNCNQKLMIEFSWEDEIYAKIYMKKSDIPNAMNKAIEYFVKNEFYEKAQEAKTLVDKSN